jgi:hypothetical protein
MNRDVKLPNAEKIAIICVNIFSPDLNMTCKEIRVAEQMIKLNILTIGF